MDPISQGALGATLSQSLSKPQQILAAGLLGALGGMAPDLDILIRSNTDPLLFLEYHRQFTHSLIFIPFGGVIVGLLLHWLIGKRFSLRLKQSLLFSTLGYATHALLDSCTSYGTQLLWPFSDARIAWNVISIIDPMFTIPIVLLVVFSVIKATPLLARIALIWALIYPVFGLVQRDRAIEVGHQIAIQRGHQPIRLEAKPSFANLLVWKTIYETEHRFYIDAVRAGVEPTIYPGESVSKIMVMDDYPWLATNSQQAKDIARFNWFSNGYIARDPNHPQRIIDIRYSMVANEINALWSIELAANAGNADHVIYLTQRERSAQTMDNFWKMIRGQSLTTQPSRQ